ncbi:hypothetical protein HPP92_013697 [Vanilla planifolia]|uniref:Uncharacterized protein n=1 Tax=Vanilla planifolia TaxID=51239 RepID=A0A835QNX5_VANPL|nr:hypothetical protein HPP92_013697 [Vanilla planifolia]
MQKIMAVIQKNSLPLQPGTADIVFSICYDTNSWKLLLKYAKMFLKAGVKLHRTAYDNIMDFAAKIGDAKSIWKTEQHRTKHLKRHTITTAFSCAKDLPDDKKPYFADALQSLISEWPCELLKKKTEEDGEVFAEYLRSGIPVLFSSLRNNGIGTTVNLEELKF